ncbi:glutathione hydrolase 1 proenzyme-like [Ptychodera flava]|uniref:glutathione hydrolase 1 proenzyme-like n=1 Tax=Ptychodera flava TaxID=63121 RepID=UPI003969D5F3
MSGILPEDLNDQDHPYVAVNGKDTVSMEEVDLSGSTSALLLEKQPPSRERHESEESHLDNGETSLLTLEEIKQPPPNEKGLKIIIICCITFAVSVTTALILHICFGPRQLNAHGAVSCGAEQCSQVGVDILKSGGHAVDSAIATILCLGVVNAQSSGIGGGGFMIVRDKTSSFAFDFRETAPGAATQDMYNDNATLAEIGGLAVAVPGELRGIEMAWKKYGRLAWPALFQPAIRLARDGFKVTGHTADSIASEGRRMAYSSRLRDIYEPNGVPVKEGDILKRPDLATVLEIIADEGADAFYKGNLTDKIVHAVKQAGGSLTKADLADYTAKMKTPLQTTYHDYQVYAVPEPSGGAVFLSIAAIMEGYNLTAELKNDPLTHHRMIEAFKFAYAQKSDLGDPDFVPNVQNLTNIMISKHAAAEIRNKIDDSKTFPPGHYGPYFPAVSKGTATATVIDPDDNMVAVTSTVNDRFGSAVMTESGILLNNEMSDFDWPNKHQDNPQYTVSQSNLIEPKKRPQSSTVPLIALQESKPCLPRIALGGDGGSRITTGALQVFLDILSFGSNAKDSIDKPRLHHQLIPNKVYVEDGVPDAILDKLNSCGHNVVTLQPLGNEFMLVMKKNDKLSAYSDARKKGSGAVVF